MDADYDFFLLEFDSCESIFFFFSFIFAFFFGSDGKILIVDGGGGGLLMVRGIWVDWGCPSV